jgi:hypothetical protein
MASAEGGIDGAAAGTTKKKKRISDCLADSDDGEDAPAVDVTPPSPPSPGTPRLRIPMFTCARLRFGRKGGRRRKKDAVVAEKSEAVPTDSSGAYRAVRTWSRFHYRPACVAVFDVHVIGR